MICTAAAGLTSAMCRKPQAAGHVPLSDESLTTDTDPNFFTHHEDIVISESESATEKSIGTALDLLGQGRYLSL